MKPWTDAAQAVYNETQHALQTAFNALNHGQQQKLMKNETVKALIERYGVVTDGGET